MPTSDDVPGYGTTSIRSAEQFPPGNLATPEDAADLDDERRALGEARAHRRRVKNLILSGICLLLLLVTLWILLVVGPI